MDIDMVNAITEVERKNFAEYYEMNGMSGLLDYFLEIGTDYVSTRLEGIGATIIEMETDRPLAIEQRKALRNALVCRLNRKSYKNNSMKVKYVEAGVSSARIELNWFR